MDAASITSPAPLTYVLPPAVTLDGIAILAAELSALPLQEQQSLVLDASAVELITTPGVQLILALGVHRAKHGGQLQLHTPSTPLVDAFLGLGLGAELQALEG